MVNENLVFTFKILAFFFACLLFLNDFKNEGGVILNLLKQKTFFFSLNGIKYPLLHGKLYFLFSVKYLK